MRVRGVPVREGVREVRVRLPRDCAAREGKIARRARVRVGACGCVRGACRCARVCAKCA